MNNNMDPCGNYPGMNQFFPFPNQNQNQDIRNLENRVYNLEREVNRLKNKVSRLENSISTPTPYSNNNYNPNEYNMM